jgi:hypothetical protein
MELEKLKYPIGKYEKTNPILIEDVAILIDEILNFPSSFSKLINTLSPHELEIPYRQGGWKVKQVIHHLADSHMNAYIRFHLTLTEDKPTIRPYKESLWAELPYLESLDIQLSLQILSSVHQRWAYLLKSLTEAQFNRCYIHPEYNDCYSLKEALGLYHWHGKHHMAHITQLINRNFDRN